MVDIPSQSAQTQAHSVVIQFDLSGVSAVFIAGQSSGGGSNGHGAFLRIFMSLVTAGHCEIEHEAVGIRARHTHTHTHTHRELGGPIDRNICSQIDAEKDTH